VQMTHPSQSPGASQRDWPRLRLSVRSQAPGLCEEWHSSNPCGGVVMQTRPWHVEAYTRPGLRSCQAPRAKACLASGSRIPTARPARRGCSNAKQ
jgi:hypothetical protein